MNLVMCVETVGNAQGEDIMDPISAAIVGAVAAGLLQGAGDASQQVVVDGYRRLKNLLVGRFGEGSDVVEAVEAVETRPDSAGRREVLAEEVVRSGADRDDEIAAAARDLLARLQQDPAVASSVQQAIGSYIAQADRHGHAEVNVNHPKA
ncbi:hypothetical protein QRN89_34645 [Streptomyces chengbuensis]|uniref:hypothetical protein n=1 Tax=Streptomyces TaxID=1883 RepID=UPI0025B2C477|nr:hypothetical protein [Streptomyces sp. HUAS CB01]WJY54488.1 hypothetical protein QRN89_34645 [Streptomyces sp. HUAS CB01]